MVNSSDVKKRIIAGVVLGIFLVLTGIIKPMDSALSEDDTATGNDESASVSSGENPNADASPDSTAGLNAFLTAEYPDGQSLFADAFTRQDFDHTIIYRTTDAAGKNHLIAYIKADDRYQVADLEPYSGLSIQSLSADPSDSDVLVIQAESRAGGETAAFRDFPAEIHYSLSKNSVLSILRRPETGVWGMSGAGKDKLSATYAVVKDAAIFIFSNETGGKTDGPEVTVQLDAKSGSPAVFGFKNTQMTASDSALDALRAMQGVQSAEFTYTETGLFTGTQLTITPKTGYKVSCSFNQNGGFGRVDDFSIQCIAG